MERKYPHVEGDLDCAYGEFLTGKNPSDRIHGFGDLEIHKFRSASTDMQRGKSGGFRVIVWIEEGMQAHRLRAYAKSEAETLPAQDILASLGSIEQEGDQ